MSTTTRSCREASEVATLPDAPTLADVLALVPSLDGAEEPAKRNMASSIRTLCRVLDREPRQVPVSAAAFRYAVEGAQPAAAGVKVKHWRNVLSSTRRAILLSGLGGKRPALKVPLTEAWERLVSPIDNRWTRNAVERFGMFCSARQIAPGEVDDEVLSRYEAYLDETQITKRPSQTTSYLARHWNGCVDQYVDWPEVRLTKPTRSRKYALDWCQLPQSLADEVRAFHEQSLNPDPFDVDAPSPVSPTTVKQRDAMLRRLAAALVAKGVAAEELASLADLVRPDRLKDGLRFFLDRNDGEPSPQLRVIVDLALLIARRWSRLGDDDVREIEILRQRVRRRRDGLTEKNKTRLRQFADDGAVDALLHLPSQLVAKAQHHPPSRRRALMVQTALAIEILLFAPIRVGNLVRLDRNRHFVWARHQGKRVLHLVIPAAEVKNDVDLEFPLVEETADLLELYMRTYQPDLANPPSGALFPGRNGGPKRENGMWAQLRSTIKRETGLDMNPHLFRHLTSLLHLEAHPGEYEVVRRVLGHKSINTTISNYLGLETAAAVRHFDQTIVARRSAGKSPQKTRRGQS